MRPPPCSCPRGPAGGGSLAWRQRSNFYAVEHLASHSTCLIKHHHGLFYYSQGSSTSSAPFPPGLSNRCPTTLSLPSPHSRLPSTSLLLRSPSALAVCSASFHRHSAPLPLRPSPSFRVSARVVSKKPVCGTATFLPLPLFSTACYGCHSAAAYAVAHWSREPA